MSKVLVDRDLLERLMRADADMGREGSASFTLDASDRLDRAWAELRAILAQPAEAEVVDRWNGLKLAAEVAEEDGPWDPRVGMTDCEAAFAKSASPAVVLELIAALSAVTAERDRLQSQLAETQANDRAAMGYLHDVRQLVGGSDFPEMVRNVARMVDALPGCVELIEALSPIEGDVLRKARAALSAPVAQTEQQPVATWMGTDWNAQQQLIAHLCKLEPGTDLYAAPIAQAGPDGWQLVPMELALLKICAEWDRQKRLFPELSRDAWMDLAIAEARCALSATSPTA